MDASQYSGTVSFYFEVVASNGATPGGFILRDDLLNDVNIAIPTSSPVTLRRSTAFTPASGLRQYQVNASSGTITSKAARIVIIQDTGSDPLSSTETQIEIGSLSTVTATAIPTGATNMTNPKYWKYTAENWDSIGAVYFEATFKGSSSKTACSVALQHDDGSFGATWVTDQTITTTNTTATRVRGATPVTLTAGRNYRIVGAAAESKTGMVIYNAKIVIQQNTAPITLLEPQYLLANTAFAAGTALQNFLTKWDSAEWSGVTNTYYHAVDSGAASSVIELDTAAGTQLTNSTVTTVAGSVQGISSAVTMPADGNLDTKATTNNGSIFANRILVAVVIGAAITSAIKTINGLAYASVKTFNSVAVANIKTILGLA